MSDDAGVISNKAACGAGPWLLFSIEIVMHRDTCQAADSLQGSDHPNMAFSATELGRETGSSLISSPARTHPASLFALGSLGSCNRLSHSMDPCTEHTALPMVQA